MKTKAQFLFITIILFLFILSIFILSTAAGTQESQKAQWKGEIVTAGGLAYAYDLILTEIEHRRFIFGYSKEYELSVIDDQGNLLYKIQKDESYQGFTAREKRKYEKHHDLPPHRPFFFSIITDSQDRIYVQRNRTRGEDFKLNREVDVFGKDGYFLYKSTIPVARISSKMDFSTLT